MKSIIALIAFGALFAYVQCKTEIEVTEYDIEHGHFHGHLGYEIRGVSHAPKLFTIRSELTSVFKKFDLLEDGKERYIVRRELGEKMSPWKIIDTVTGKQIGLIKKQRGTPAFEMIAVGEFGLYTIHVKFGYSGIIVEKDGFLFAKIYQKTVGVHTTYGLTVFGDADRALMVLFSVVVEETLKN